MYLILSFLMSLSVFSAERINLVFSQTSVKQGALLEATIKVDTATAQNLELQKIKGLTAGKTIYFYKISPLVRKDGAQDFEADAKIIFLKPPKDIYLQDRMQGRDLTISWSPISVVPTETPKSFLFAKFDVPARQKILIWILITVMFLVVIIASTYVYKKIQTKKEAKKQKLEMKNKILSAESFDEIVEVWKNKRLYFILFPHLEDNFKKFEATLFKYQFKPSQNEREIAEIKASYKEFVSSIRGGFNGI